MKVFTKVCEAEEIDAFIAKTQAKQPTELEDVEIIPHSWYKQFNPVINNGEWGVKQPSAYNRKRVDSYLIKLTFF